MTFWKPTRPTSSGILCRVICCATKSVHTDVGLHMRGFASCTRKLSAGILLLNRLQIRCNQVDAAPRRKGGWWLPLRLVTQPFAHLFGRLPEVVQQSFFC